MGYEGASDSWVERAGRRGIVDSVEGLLERHGQHIGEKPASVERLRDIRNEMERISDHERPTMKQATRFDELAAEAEQIGRTLRDQSVERMGARLRSGDLVVDSGVPAGGDTEWHGPYETIGRGDTFDRAKRTVDALHRSGQLPDHAAAKVFGLVDYGTPADRPVAAQWAVATGSEHYRSAFNKLLSDPHRGHMLFTEPEADAYRETRRVATLMRAMSTGSGAGGEMIPLTLDPSILLSSDGSVDPIRRIARTVQTATDTWQGVTSEGVTAEWLAEAGEAADASPTLTGPSIPVHKGSAFIPFSFEVGMDAVDLTGELAPLLSDAADQLMAEAHITGSGTGEPTGITVGLAAGSQVAAATADTLVAADVFGLQNVLPPRFQARAQWASNLATANEIQQFETTAGVKVFPEIANGQLLRKPWNEASFLDAAGDTATAGNDNVLLYGDFQRAVVLVDRIGTTVELIANLIGANQRPTGQRGLFMWFRHGSDVVVDNALRLLTA